MEYYIMEHREILLIRKVSAKKREKGKKRIIHCAKRAGTGEKKCFRLVSEACLGYNNRRTKRPHDNKKQPERRAPGEIRQEDHNEQYL